jgi:hypothetical protein
LVVVEVEHTQAAVVMLDKMVALVEVLGQTEPIQVLQRKVILVVLLVMVMVEVVLLLETILEAVAAAVLEVVADLVMEDQMEIFILEEVVVQDVLGQETTLHMQLEDQVDGMVLLVQQVLLILVMVVLVQIDLMSHMLVDQVWLY